MYLLKLEKHVQTLTAGFSGSASVFYLKKWTVHSQVKVRTAFKHLQMI